MKTTKMTMLAFTAMTAIALTLSSCGGEKKEAATETPATEIAINTTHKYICPMNCEGSASMEPGKCPVCGMDLVENPNYAGGDAVVADTTALTPDSAGSQTTDGHSHENHEGHNH